MSANVEIKQYLIGNTAFYVKKQGKKVIVKFKDINDKSSTKAK